MTLTRCQADLLRRLAETPFTDRLDLAALSGWSRGAVYAAMDRLAEGGMASAIPHATPLLPPTRRYFLTAEGVEALAELEGVSPDGLLRSRTVSARWQRALLERLDAAGVIYRLAAAIANAGFPMAFRWYRAAPADAGIVLPGGRTVAVVRQGDTADRTGFAKRLWRLREGTQPGGLLALAPDLVRLRQARRLLAGAPFPVFAALERDAALAGPDSPVWFPPSIPAALDLRSLLARLERGGGLPADEPESQPRLPPPIGLDLLSDIAPGWLLTALLSPAEKGALDLLSDWPWASRLELAGIMGVSARRASQLLDRLGEFGLVGHAGGPRTQRLAVTDRGLALLARRDRTSLGAARRRWSAAPLDTREPLTWRNGSGSRTRQLLRNEEHTGAVHGFLAALAEQARAAGWQVVQLDPPRRASRYFRHDGRLHSVLPDAFGILRRGAATVPFFLEWERRAVRPATMTARLAPYLRYYSSHRPLDDHGVKPVVLVVFDDELAATNFLGLARREMDQAGVEVPLRVSHRAALERPGPLVRAWLTPGSWEPGCAFEG